MIRKFYDMEDDGKGGWISTANPNYDPNKKNFFELLRGRVRLLFGNCPKCNSDAPEMYNCTICDFKDNYHGRKKSEDRKYWWNRFIQKAKQL